MHSSDLLACPFNLRSTGFWTSFTRVKSIMACQGRIKLACFDISPHEDCRMHLKMQKVDDWHNSEKRNPFIYLRYVVNLAQMVRSRATLLKLCWNFLSLYEISLVLSNIFVVFGAQIPSIRSVVSHGCEPIRVGLIRGPCTRLCLWGGRAPRKCQMRFASRHTHLWPGAPICRLLKQPTGQSPTKLKTVFHNFWRCLYLSSMVRCEGNKETSWIQ